MAARQIYIYRNIDTVEMHLAVICPERIQSHYFGLQIASKATPS